MINHATKTARKSKFKRTKMGAVIANKDKILFCGENQIRYYKTCPAPRKWENSLHAEQSCILKALKKNRQKDLVGSTIYVSRIRKNGTLGLARPCEFCMELIKVVGIKRIIYTTNEQSTKTIELR